MQPLTEHQRRHVKVKNCKDKENYLLGIDVPNIEQMSREGDSAALV